nr:MAG TPA: Transcription initiation factor IIE, alpha FINGER, Transcription [Caudoviricetes sp.]
MRLIDADYVLTHLKPYEPSDEEWGVTGGTALRLIHTAINNAPTVDVVPVMHGDWKGYFPHCSICGEEALSRDNGTLHGAYFLTDYCPNCGAKMQEGVE